VNHTSTECEGAMWIQIKGFQVNSTWWSILFHRRHLISIIAVDDLFTKDNSVFILKTIFVFQITKSCARWSSLCLSVCLSYDVDLKVARGHPWLCCFYIKTDHNLPAAYHSVLSLVSHSLLKNHLFVFSALVDLQHVRVVYKHNLRLHRPTRFHIWWQQYLSLLSMNEQSLTQLSQGNHFGVMTMYSPLDLSSVKN
jgi:hypothetical protein